MHIPASVLSLDSMDDEFCITSDTVLCKVSNMSNEQSVWEYYESHGCQVREGVVTRIGVSKTDDNNVTIAGLAVMDKLGLTKADLQVNISCIQGLLLGPSISRVSWAEVESLPVGLE